MKSTSGGTDEAGYVHKGDARAFKVLCKVTNGFGRLRMGVTDPDSPAELQGVSFEPLELAMDGRCTGDIVQKDVSVAGSQMEIFCSLIGLGTAGSDAVDKEEIPFFDYPKGFGNLPGRGGKS